MKKQVLKYKEDETGRLGRFMEKVRKEYFPKLSPANIHYVFRTVPKNDDEGMVVLGEAKKLPNRERDLYHYDFEICVFEKTWKGFDESEKRRLAWHELNHCVVKYKGGDVKRDKADRIVIGLKKHDLVLKTFMEEIETFGPTNYEAIVIRKIQSYKGGRKIKRRKK